MLSLFMNNVKLILDTQVWDMNIILGILIQLDNHILKVQGW